MLLPALALGVVGLLLIFILRPREPVATPEIPELLLAEAFKEDGRFFAIGTTNPFSGWVVEYYDDELNRLRSRTAVSNGLLHGTSEGWHTNGQLQVRESFEDGVGHGIRTKWRADGTKLSEGTIINGEFEGFFRKWHPNGRLWQELRLKGGKPHGESRSWYASGALKSRAVMNEGEIVEQEFFEDSAPSVEGEGNEESALRDRDPQEHGMG